MRDEDRIGGIAKMDLDAFVQPGGKELRLFPFTPDDRNDVRAMTEQCPA